MGAVDIADQLATTDYSCRRIRRGTWQALEHWLLSTVLVNTYLVSLYSNIDEEREVKFRNQRDFRMQIIEGLLAMSKPVPVPKKRYFSHSNCDDSDILITDHHHDKRPTKRDCMACKGGTYWERQIRRSPLAALSANQGRAFKRRTTFYGCIKCDVALCKKGSCFAIIIIIIIIPLTCCISQRLYNTLQKSVDLTQKGPSNTR